jgi:hypothetical protein
MIVASLLLILVAVTLLVLGLVGGSSSLLTSSIVASLLAAVALVIGARQASAARRATTAPAGDAARPGRRPADLPLAGDEAYDDEPAAYAAGSRDADAHLTGPDATQRVQPDADLYDYDDAAAGRTSSGQAAGPASQGSAPDADYDYERAATVIGEARSDDADDQSWRREAASESEPVVPGASASAATSATDDESGEFDEPDPDDPDDEPLPQAVRPADAVRVARLDAEVLVVDGRPRYHLADCPHLVGRLTEGLPVAEAVELGFSPCGLCRPVDRLVAAAARH